MSCCRMSEPRVLLVDHMINKNLALNTVGFCRDMFFNCGYGFTVEISFPATVPVP